MADPSVAAILVAAGSGTRLGADVPKALVELDGRTLLWHAVTRLAPAVERLVVVGPPDHQAVTDEQTRAALADAGLGDTPAVVVPGGATRAASVGSGLAAAGEVDVVAVHDVARPLATAEVLRRCVAALEDGADATAPAVPVTDTLKRVADDGVRVVGTEDRAPLRGVQTPQVFPRATLQAAHARAGDPDVTDDLALVESMGGRVVLVPGSQRLMKITHPLDLVLAAALLADERGRVGAP